MTLSDITRDQVLDAVRECDRLGRETFLRQYGFGRARRYLLLHDGKTYDSKAIVGVAHGFLPGETPLTANEFSGGEDRVARLLRRLGFTVMDQDPGAADDLDELLTRIARLRVNRASGRPALYQPITLLWAIGRVRRGERRMLAWEDTEKALRLLLERHGTHGERSRPDYPIAALYHAGLWELAGYQGRVPPAHGDTELQRWFAANSPTGGLQPPIYELLHRSGNARVAVIDAILQSFFTDADYSSLLQDVGLFDAEIGDDLRDSAAAEEFRRKPGVEYERLCGIVERAESRAAAARVARTSFDPVRSAAARKAVLARCSGHCENPGCSGQPHDVTDRGDPILEVDHIHDIALGGRDHPEQMIALCPNCHAVKTRGRTREELRRTLLVAAKERHAATLAATSAGQPE